MEASSCNFVHILDNSTSPDSDCLLAVLEDMSDESIPVLNMDSWANCLFIIILLIACTGLNSMGKAFTVYYIKQRAPDRPLNDMILIDQVLLLHKQDIQCNDFTYFCSVFNSL